MRVAAEAFAEIGLRQVTMEQVAERAGASKVVLYRYFGSKDNLINAVLQGVVDKVLAADSDDNLGIIERVTGNLKVARENKHAFNLLLRHTAHDPVFGVHYHRLHTTLVHRALARQREALDRLFNGNEPTLFSRQFLSETAVGLLYDGFLRWLDEGDEANDDAFIDWITRSIAALTFYWAGVEPPGGCLPSGPICRKKD